jgi:hypothetical protein
MEKKAKNLLHITAGSVLCLAFGYNMFLGAAMLVSNAFSERISNQQQLERIISEEKKKIGSTTPLSVRLYSKEEAKARGIKHPQHVKVTYENGEVTHRIDMIEGYFATRAITRHEIHHFANKNIDKMALPKHPNAYWFISEPAANLYALTGINF